MVDGDSELESDNGSLTGVCESPKDKAAEWVSAREDAVCHLKRVSQWLFLFVHHDLSTKSVLLPISIDHVGAAHLL